MHGHLKALPSTGCSVPVHRVARDTTNLERAVLSAMLVDQDAAALGTKSVSPEHFTAGLHRLVFFAIRELQLEAPGRPVDVTLVDAKISAASECVGADWLAELSHVTPSPGLIDRYLTELDGAYNKRRFVELQDSAAQSAEDGRHDEARVLLREAMELPVDGLSLQEDPLELEVTAALADITKAARGGVVGRTTGYKGLDGKLGGFVPARLYTLYAHTGVGKTYFALQMALACARSGGRVHWWPKEMSGVEMTTRVLGLLAGVSVDPVYLRGVEESELQGLRDAADIRRQLPITFDDRRQSLGQMLRQARSHRGEVALYVVDPIQMVKVDGADGIFDETRQVTRDLKQLAIDTKAAVLAVSHINRDGAETWDPAMQALKGGSSIEQDSDVILGLARKRVEGVAQAKVTCHKNRGGKGDWTLPLAWDEFRAGYSEVRGAEGH